MTNLSIQDVPGLLAEQLRRRAARHHRSLQDELMTILEQAVAADAVVHVDAPARPIAALGWGGGLVLRRGDKTIEDIAAEHRLKLRRAAGTTPIAADSVRANRDGR